MTLKILLLPFSVNTFMFCKRTYRIQKQIETYLFVFQLIINRYGGNETFLRVKLFRFKQLSKPFEISFRLHRS